MSKINLNSGREIALPGGRYVAVFPVVDQAGEAGLTLRFRRPTGDNPDGETATRVVEDGEIITRVYLSTEAAMALGALLSTADFALAGGES